MSLWRISKCACLRKMLGVWLRLGKGPCTLQPHPSNTRSKTGTEHMSSGPLVNNAVLRAVQRRMQQRLSQKWHNVDTGEREPSAVVFSVKLHGEAESSNITMQSNKVKWTKPKPVHDSTVSAIVGWQCVCVLCVCHRRCKLSKCQYGQSA